MTAVLASLLVQQNLVSAGAMDDLLKRQSSAGGSLDTNLLEEGLLDEASLTRALADVYHLPAATADLLERHDTRIPNIFPARLAQKYHVAPVALSGRTLLLLASTRLHPLIEEEIGFMLSVSIKTSVVCEARLRLLQRDWMGLEIEPRYVALAERLGRYPIESAPEPTADAAPTGERAASDAVQIEPDAAQSEPAVADEPPSAEIALSDRISLDAATRGCLQASSRDEIVDITLRFAHQFLSYVGLFVISNEQILGWNAMGIPESRERIRTVRLPINSPSVLRTVMQTRAHFLGPVPSSGINDELLRAMGRDNPRNVLIVPLTLQNHLLGLFFGDDGERSIQTGRLTELLVFINRLAPAFEQLIHQRKSHVAAPLPVEAPQKQPKSEPQPLIVETVPSEAAPHQNGFIPMQQAPAITAGEVAPSSTMVPLQQEAPHRPELTIVEVSDETAPPAAHVPEGEAPVTVVNIHAELDTFQPMPMVSVSDESAPTQSVTAAPRVTESPVDFSVRVEPPARSLPREAPMLDLGTPSTQSAQGEKPISQDVPEPVPEPEGREPWAKPQPQAAARVDDAVNIAVLSDELICAEPMRMERAREHLTRIGSMAVPALMERFPGHLTFEIRGNNDHIPPVAEHGELLRCLVEIGSGAAEAIAKRLDDPKRRVRYYAVKLLGVISYPAAVARLAQRLFDREVQVRLATLETLATYRQTPQFSAMLLGLRAKLEQTNPDQQAIAAALLGNFKDRNAVPILIKLIKSSHKMVRRAAIESLSFITKQDFDANQRKWLKWWELHGSEHRIQWLIEGLRSNNRDVRFSSSQELTQITGEYFGYYYDSGKKDLERAVLQWEAWWIEKGRRIKFDD